MKKILLLIGIVFVLSTGNSLAQIPILKWEADSLTKLGTNYIYNIEFDKAEKCFREVVRRYPQHPVGYFMDAMVDWWKITIYRDTKKFESSFLSKIDKVIQVSEAEIARDPTDVMPVFFKAGAIGYRARLYAQNEEWLKAAKDGAEAYSMMVRCYELAPGNHDIMLGTGIYNYFAAAIPEKYPLVKPIMTFFPRGDKQIGILQLKAAANKALYANVEAKVVLLQLFYSFEKNSWEAMAIAEDLSISYPNNPYFHRYLGRTYVRMGMLDKFEKVWREVLLRCMDRWKGYDNETSREAMYYIALALYERSDYNNAFKYLYKCDEWSRKLDKGKDPSGFMVQANVMMAKMYDLQGKRNYAQETCKKLLRMPDNAGSHAFANTYMWKPFKK